MLKEIDLSKRLGKEELEQKLPELKLKLGEAQRRARDAGIPIIVIFEGWEASSMAKVVNQFILPMDPRGFTYYNIGEPERSEKDMPFMWRFWRRTPERGRIVIFDRSWYSQIVADCVEDGKCKKPPEAIVDEINRFEKLLADDGVVIVKLFLHTSKRKVEKAAERADRFEACGLVHNDLDIMKQYNTYLPLLDDLLEDTHTAQAPWTIVESDDYEFAVSKVFRKVIERIGKAMDSPPEKKAEDLPPLTGRSERAKVDLSPKVPDAEYRDSLAKYQTMMGEVQCDLFQRKKRLIVVFEGRDASGKGGDIARLAQALNPRSYQVASITAPNDPERAHHYLWRFYNRLPAPGHVTIFDRSWYGRVLVERVEGFASGPEWKRAYGEINDFEKMLADDDTIIVKLWLEVDKATQLKRFIERVDDPTKTWKITADDWKARERWDAYTEAIDEMLLRTSTKVAPWTVVESNDKNYSRIKTLRTIVDTTESELKS